MDVLGFKAGLLSDDVQSKRLSKRRGLLGLLIGGTYASAFPGRTNGSADHGCRQGTQKPRPRPLFLSAHPVKMGYLPWSLAPDCS